MVLALIMVLGVLFPQEDDDLTQALGVGTLHVRVPTSWHLVADDHGFVARESGANSGWDQPAGGGQRLRLPKVGPASSNLDSARRDFLTAVKAHTSATVTILEEPREVLVTNLSDVKPAVAALITYQEQGGGDIRRLVSLQSGGIVYELFFDAPPGEWPKVRKLWDRIVDRMYLQDLASATTAATPISSATPSGSPAGRIAFSSERDGDPEIYVMNSDGSALRRLTNSPADDAAAAWSPDGRQIAFSSDRSGNYEIYVMNTDGSNVRRLTNLPTQDIRAEWSPDGSRILFVALAHINQEEPGQVYMMNADGSGTRPAIFDMYDPSWSPDGRGVLGVGTDGRFRLVSGGLQLLRPEAVGRQPRFSPDGRLIVYAHTESGNADIYVANADGSNPIRLTTAPGDDYFPHWSSDGRRITFTSERDGNPEIYVMNADGSAQTRLTNHPARDANPSWSVPLP